MSEAAKDAITEPIAWRPCPYCDDGLMEDECTCGDDTCCCLDPDPPECPYCRGMGGWQIPFSQASPDDGDIV